MMFLWPASLLANLRTLEELSKVMLSARDGVLGRMEELEKDRIPLSLGIQIPSKQVGTRVFLF